MISNAPTASALNQAFGGRPPNTSTVLGNSPTVNVLGLPAVGAVTVMEGVVGPEGAA